MNASSTPLWNRALIKDTLWAFAFVGLVAAVLRFTMGLGYATGMNDTTPWGLWIAFKLAFVAMAGGGFVLAGAVYIIHLETYRPVLRPAILIALLGYGSFVVSLLFDLGLPWHIYMPIIRWQHYSVMFEIAWCVMLYFTVLNLEFGPVILEHPWFRHPIFRWVRWMLHRAIIPIVIVGIALSTLHQSSLGSLFLIMPFRVHPLWYSPLIPVFFLMSAIGLGLMVLVLEGFVADRLFRRELHIDPLSRLGAIAGVILWVYIALRLGDLAMRGVIPSALDGSWQSILFAAEILIGGILPATLLMIPKVRNRREGLITAGLLTAFGVINQRMSLSLFTMWRPGGTGYTPTGLEVAIALSIPAAAGLIYIFLSENLAVSEQERPDQQLSPYAKPRFDQSTGVLIESTLGNSAVRRSGLAALVMALTIATLPSGVMTTKRGPTTPSHAAKGWEVMAIDGNQADDVVYFNHVDHQSRSVEQVSSEQHVVCTGCHHLSKPGDEATACWECHRDVYLSMSIFDHTLHQVELGGNTGCVECHVGEHMPNTAKACQECHETMAPKVGETTFHYMAPGYKQAMHRACIACHESEAKAHAKPELAHCPACHQLDENDVDLQMALDR